MMRGAWTVLILLVLAFVAFRVSTFTVAESEQAVVLQFGKPVGEPVTRAGLHFRTPFIQDVRGFDKRVLSWDGDVQEYKTRDKKLIRIDIFARWRIVDALTFLKTVNNENSAQSRLDDFIDSSARKVVANHRLAEVIRDTNRPEASGVAEEEAWKPERISVGRSNLERRIFESVAPNLPSLGIKLVDVRVKRVNYSEGVRNSVYQRMIAERERIAEKFRSEGRGIAAEWQGRRERDLQRIHSEAFRNVQEVRAGAEAEAARIYADAFGKDEEFYAFWRSMQVYPKLIDESTTMVLPLSSPVPEYLDSPKPR